MTLIDKTYFTGEITLPNIPTSAWDASGGVGVGLALQTVGENSLDVFVDKYVTDYLIKLLGREMTLNFLDGLKQTTPLQIWLDLKDVLLTEIGSCKTSPLAYYVYFHVMSDAVTKTTTGGEADPEFDFAKNASSKHKMINAWNNMVEMTYPIVYWLKKHAADYSTYYDCGCGIHINELLRPINQFGI